MTLTIALLTGVPGCRPAMKEKKETAPLVRKSPDPPRPKAERSAAPPEMRWAPLAAGVFRMGAASGDPDERPVHEVKIPAMLMGRSEVTVAQYRGCVAAGACARPRIEQRCNWEVPGRGDHPVNCVTWHQARSFCRWKGARLPTESEWEYAARSGGKARAYPWGDEAASCRRSVMDSPAGTGCGKGRTWPVCSLPAGRSIQGLCDLSGNVWEWVEDCWHGSYEGAPGDGSAWSTDCKGAGRMVIRGSSWHVGTADDVRARTRDSSQATGQLFGIGFRCVRSPR